MKRALEARSAEFEAVDDVAQDVAQERPGREDEDCREDVDGDDQGCQVRLRDGPAERAPSP
jgi:hypothetical protein